MLWNTTALPLCPSCMVTHPSHPGEMQEYILFKVASTAGILPHEELHRPRSLWKGPGLETVQVWSHQGVCIQLLSIITCILWVGEAAATLMNHLVDKLSMFKRLHKELFHHCESMLVYVLQAISQWDFGRNTDPWKSSLGISCTTPAALLFSLV